MIATFLGVDATYGKNGYHLHSRHGSLGPLRTAADLIAAYDELAYHANGIEYDRSWRPVKGEGGGFATVTPGVNPSCPRCGTELIPKEWASSNPVFACKSCKVCWQCEPGLTDLLREERGEANRG